VLLVFLTGMSLIRMLPSDGYHGAKDCWTFTLLAVPTTLLLSFYVVPGHDFLTTLIAFSQILEVVVIVPQLVLFVRDKKVHYAVGTYVLLLSISCGCYVADWWHRLVFLHEEPLPNMTVAIITTVLQFLVTFGAGLPIIVIVSQKAALGKNRFVLAMPKKLKPKEDGSRHSL
ncbi:hypothetical protein AAVH_34909, partial [Aphelenchoides avenae]